jgi:hypothetical protein
MQCRLQEVKGSRNVEHLPKKPMAVSEVSPREWLCGIWPIGVHVKPPRDSDSGHVAKDLLFSLPSSEFPLVHHSFLYPSSCRLNGMFTLCSRMLKVCNLLFDFTQVQS